MSTSQSKTKADKVLAVIDPDDYFERHVAPFAGQPGYGFAYSVWIRGTYRVSAASTGSTFFSDWLFLPSRARREKAAAKESRR